jgi:small GTP-binding protein
MLFWKMNSPNFVFKIVVIGDSCVGKSNIINSYINRDFVGDHNSTIGVDFKIKEITLNNNIKVKFQLWDTSGQERYRSVLPAYYRGAHAIMYTYAVNDIKSLNQLISWRDETAKYVELDNVVKYVVGNKIDMESKTVLEEELNVASNLNATLVKVSAKDFVNLDDLFESICTELVNFNGDKYEKPAVNIAVKPIKVKPITCC